MKLSEWRIVQLGIIIGVVLLFLIAGRSFAVPPVDIQVDLEGSGSPSPPPSAPVRSTTGGPLVLGRVELRFENDRGETAVPLNGKIKAKALINYTGNGILKAQWVVDDRVIQQVTRTLVYGTDIVVETNEIPQLPTFEPGQHSVTLQIISPIISPDSDFTIPTIYYFVQTGGISPDEAGIQLYIPNDGTHLYKGQLRFSWYDPAGTGFYEVQVWGEIPPSPSGLRIMDSGTTSKDLRLDTKSAIEKGTIIRAQTRDPGYQPPAALLERLNPDREYEWEVVALSDDGLEVGRSETRSFKIRAEPVLPEDGGIFFRHVLVSQELFPEHGGVAVTPTHTTRFGDMGGGRMGGYEGLITSLNLVLSMEVSAGEIWYLYPRIENSMNVKQNGLILEVHDGGNLLSRLSIQYIEPNQYRELPVPWPVPILSGGGGRLTLTISQDGHIMDKAEITWSAPVTFSMAGLDFAELSEPVLPPIILEEYGCLITESYFGPNGLTPNLLTQDAFPDLIPSMASGRIIAMNVSGKASQTLGEVSYFQAGKGEIVRFTGVITDNGLARAYAQQFEICKSWKEGIADRLRFAAANIENAVAQGRFNPAPPVMLRQDRLTETNTLCRESLSYEKFTCLMDIEKEAESYSRDALIAEADAARAAADGIAPASRPDKPQAETSPAPGYPMTFIINRLESGNSLTPIWEDSEPVFLGEGDKNKKVFSSNWTVPETGTYLVTIHNYPPGATLYATYPNGLPTHLLMAGFELKVIDYEKYDEYSALNEGLSGTATAIWNGDQRKNQLELKFENIHISMQGDPLYGKVIGGTARLLSENVPLKLKGTSSEKEYRIILKGLNLNAFEATADLSYDLPEHFRTTDNSAIDFSNVPILNGGEFIVEHKFPVDFPDFSVGDGDLAIRMANGALIADFSPHLGYDSYSTNAAWQGIGLAGGIVRARIRPRSDNPDLGLFQTLNYERAFLYGEFAFITVSSIGDLEGEAAVKPVAAVNPFFKETPDPTVQLAAPLGFALEIEGGVFQVTGDGIGGIDLSGKIYLPDIYHSAAIQFKSFKRIVYFASEETLNNGFTTEEIEVGLPRLTLNNFNYSPETAVLKIPMKAEDTEPLSAVVKDSGLKTESGSKTEYKFFGESLSAPASPEPGSGSFFPPKPDEWPEDAKDLAKWVAKAKARMNNKYGLHLYGGSLELPWEDAEPVTVPTASPSTGSADSSIGSPAGNLRESAIYNVENLDISLITGMSGFMEGGLFLLDSGGINGIWQRIKEPGYKRVGDFTAKVSGTYLEFMASYLVDSKVEGDLVIPYPSDLMIGFSGELDAGAKIMVPENGLIPPSTDNSWQLDYWKCSLWPSPDAGFYYVDPFEGEDRIEIRQANLVLDVDPEYGGPEFFDSEYGTVPFCISLDIKPDGNIVNPQMALVSQTPGVEPETSGAKTETLRPDTLEIAGRVPDMILFLGIDFTPEAFDGAESPFKFRRYYGENRPASGDPPTGEWLIQVTGKISLDLFGERKVRIYHTAMGARVPFIEYREEGVSDSSGVLELFTQKLRFINTFARSREFIEARAQEYEPDESSGGATNTFVTDESPDPAGFRDVKEFIGMTEISVLNTFHINGLSEAGTAIFQPQLNQQGEPVVVDGGCYFNPCSFEKIGIGGGIDILKAVLAGVRGVRTAAKIGGAVVEATTGVEGVEKEIVQVCVETSSLVSDIVTAAMSSAACAETGAACAWTEEEIRNIVGDGLGLAKSSVALANAIYLKQGNPEDDEVAISLAVAELALEASQLAARWEEIDPEQVIHLLLGTADEVVTLLKRLEFEGSVEYLALSLSHMAIKIARPFLEEGGISDQELYEILADSFMTCREILDLEGVNLGEEIESFVSLALTIGETVTRSGSGREIEPDLAIAVIDEVLDFLCEHRDLVVRGIEIAGTAANGQEDIDVYAGSALAAGQLTIDKLKELRARLSTQPVIDAEEYAEDFVIPVIDGLLSGTETCGDIDLDNDIKIVLRILKPTIRVAIQARSGEGIPGAVLRFLTEVIDGLSEYDPSLFAGSPIEISTVTGTLENLSAAFEVQTEEEAAIKVADALFPLVEETANKTGAESNILAAIHTAEAVKDGAKDMVSGYTPSGAAGAVKNVVYAVSEFQSIGGKQVDDTIRASLALIIQMLEIIRETAGGDGLAPAAALRIAGRTLGILDQRLSTSLNEGQKAAVKIGILIVEQGRIAFSGSGGGLSMAESLLSGLVDIMRPDDEVAGALDGLLINLNALTSPPGSIGQETLAILTSRIIDTALEAGVSEDVRIELLKAQLFLRNIREDNCKDMENRDDNGNIVSKRKICDDAVIRGIDYESGLVVVEYPSGHPRYPGGRIEHYQLSPSQLDPNTDVCSINTDTGRLVYLETLDNAGRKVKWNGFEATLKVEGPAIYETCPSMRFYLDVPSPPYFNNSGVVETGDLVEMSKYIEAFESCLWYDVPDGIVEREWNNGDFTRYENKGLDMNNRPILTGRILYHKALVNWSGKDILVEYEDDGSYNSLSAQGALVDQVDIMIPGDVIDIEAIKTTPPEGWVSYKSVVGEGYLDLYLFDSRVYMHGLTPARTEFYTIDESVGAPAVPEPGVPPEFTPFNSDKYEFIFWTDADGNMFTPYTNQPVTEPIYLGKGVEIRPGSVSLSLGGQEQFRIDENGVYSSLTGVEHETRRTEDGRFIETWTDNDGTEHERMILLDARGLPGITIEKTIRPDGRIIELHKTVINNIETRIKITTLPDGRQVQEIRKDDGPWQVQRTINLKDPLVFLEIDRTRVTLPPQPVVPDDDPQRLVKQLKIIQYMETEASVLASPDPDMDAARSLNVFKDSGINGLNERIAYAKAQVYGKILSKALRDFETVAEDLPKMRGFYGQCEDLDRLRTSQPDVPDCEPPDENNPFPVKVIFSVLDHVQSESRVSDSASLLYADDVIRTRMADAFGMIYLGIKSHYERTGFALDPQILVKISMDINNWGINEAEDFARIYGTEESSVDLETFKTDICLAYSRDMQRIMEQMESGRTVPTDIDLTYSTFFLNETQIIDCPTQEEIEANEGGQYDELIRRGYCAECLGIETTQEILTEMSREVEGWRDDFSKVRSWLRLVLPKFCMCGTEGEWYTFDVFNIHLNKLKEKLTSGSLEQRMEALETLNTLRKRQETIKLAGEGNLSASSSALFQLFTSDITESDTGEGVPRCGMNFDVLCPQDAGLPNAFSGERSGVPDMEDQRRDTEETYVTEVDRLIEDAKNQGNEEIYARTVKKREDFKQAFPEAFPEGDPSPEDKAREELRNELDQALDSERTDAPDLRGHIEKLFWWKKALDHLNSSVNIKVAGFEEIVRLWLDDIALSLPSIPAEEEIDRMKAAIRVALALGITQFTGEVEDALNRAVTFLTNVIVQAIAEGQAVEQDVYDRLTELQNIIKEAGGQIPEIGFGEIASLPVVLPLILFFGEDILTLNLEAELMRLMKECYLARRGEMISRRDEASIGMFAGVAEAVELSGRSGEFYRDPEIPEGDPFNPVEEVLASLIDDSSSCLNTNTCSAYHFGKLIRLAAESDALGHRAQSVRAMEKAEEIVQRLISAIDPSEVDTSGLMKQLDELAAASEQTRALVADLMQRIIDGFTRKGQDAMDDLGRLMKDIESLLKNPPEFSIPSGYLDPLRQAMEDAQQQIARWIAEAEAGAIATLDEAEGGIDRFIKEISDVIWDASTNLRLPDIALPEFPIPPQHLDCGERMRQAMLHLEIAVRLAGSGKGAALTRLAGEIYRDYSLGPWNTPTAVTLNAIGRSGGFLASAIMNRAASGLEELITAVVDGAIAMASGKESGKESMEGILGSLSFPAGEGTDPAHPLALSGPLLDGLFESVSGEEETDWNQIITDFKNRLAGGADEGLKLVGSAMNAFYSLPTEPPPEVAGVLAFLGNIMVSPIKGWVKDAGAGSPLPELIETTGKILRRAKENDFYITAAVETGNAVAAIFFPDQPVITVTFRWASDFLREHAPKDLKVKIDALHQDDEFGIKKLELRLSEIEGANRVNFPGALVRVPLAGMLELLNRAEELRSEEEQGAALAHIFAAVINQMFPAGESRECPLTEGTQHPVACLIRAIAEPAKADPALAFIAVRVVESVEGWIIAGPAMEKFRISPVLNSLVLVAVADSPEAAALTALIELPNITQKILGMAGSNPAWQPIMGLLAGDCQRQPLKLDPPDHCGTNGVNNLVLALLEEARIKVLEREYNMGRSGQPLAQWHNDNPVWGYLKTVPVLAPPGDPDEDDVLSMAPDTSPGMNPGNWDSLAENLQDPKKAIVGSIDLARLLLNMAAVFDSSDEYDRSRYADRVLGESVFAGMVGEEGDFFTGVAGGLLKSAPLGEPKEHLYLELIGRIKLPALATIAGQLSFTRDDTYGWGLQIRTAGDIPDFANLADAFPEMPAKTVFDGIAKSLDDSGMVGLEWDLDGFIGDRGSQGHPDVVMDLSAMLDAEIFEANVLDVAMSGKLEPENLTGELCLDADTDILASWVAVLGYLEPLFLSGFSALPTTDIKVGGSIWHQESPDSTGVTFKIGAKRGRELEFLGFDIAGLMVGADVGFFASHADGIGMGPCITPYLSGSIGDGPLTYTFDASLGATVFVREYVVEKYEGSGDNRRCENLNHAGMGYELDACIAGGNCKPIWFFFSDEGVFFGFNANFPEKEDDWVLSTRGPVQAKGWAGKPDGAERCNPFTRCGGYGPID